MEQLKQQYGYRKMWGAGQHADGAVKYHFCLESEIW